MKTVPASCLFGIAGFLLLNSLCAWAEPLVADPSPVTSLVHRAAETAAWKIEVRKKRDTSKESVKAPATPPPLGGLPFASKTVTKMGDVYHQVCLGWDGQISEAWTVLPVTLHREKPGGKIIVLDPRASNSAPKLDLTDFCDSLLHIRSLEFHLTLQNQLTVDLSVKQTSPDQL